MSVPIKMLRKQHLAKTYIDNGQFVCAQSDHKKKKQNCTPLSSMWILLSLQGLVEDQQTTQLAYYWSSFCITG